MQAVRRIVLRSRPVLRPKPASIPILQQQLRFASKKAANSNKKSKRNLNDRDESEEVPIIQTRGSKGKKGSVSSEVVGDVSLPGERFDIVKAESVMQNSIERLRVSLKNIVGRVGRVNASILDPLRVEIDGQKYRLQDYASVSVIDGTTMKVNLYDPTYLSQVERALYDFAVALNPQREDDSTIRIKISKPDVALRENLTREASKLCENARVAIRNTRHQGQKDIKKDESDNVISMNDAKSEMKKLDEITKKQSTTVDKIFEEAKSVIMDE